MAENDFQCLNLNEIQSDCYIEEADKNYLEDITKLLTTHDTVSMENALELNKNMQMMLLKLKIKLEKIICDCKRKYEQIEELLSLEKLPFQNKIRTHYLNNYSFCQSPFFKDERLFSAPLDSEYMYRKEVLKQFFPNDLLFKVNSVWTLKDKIGIIQGIKKQVIEYIERKEKKSSKKSIYQWENPKTIEGLKNKISLHSNLLVDLLKKVDDNFQINWYRISMEYVNGRHPENCCKAMWTMYLKPDLNRKPWTAEENQKLLEVMKTLKFKGWDSIAQEMRNRSAHQCLVQYKTHITHRLEENFPKWTNKDDELLVKIIECCKFGDSICWYQVWPYFQKKTTSQIYGRYKYCIDPSINHASYTKEEDCIILAAVQEYGESFRYIPRSLFSGRTILQVKSRYFNVLKPNTNQRSWTTDDDKKLLALVEQHGSSNWVPISKELKFHSRTSCRTRYSTIQKFLIKHPRKSIEDIPRKNRKSTTDVTMDNWIEKILECRNCDEKEVFRGRKTKRTKMFPQSHRRRIKQDYYDFFKYSYDFSFGELKILSFSSERIVKFLYTAFKIDVDPKEFKMFEDILKVREPENLENILKSTANRQLLSNSTQKFRLPPNKCTMLALRAICIHFDEHSESDMKIEDTAMTANAELVRITKEKFINRFFATFHKTLVLSQMSPIGVLPLPENYSISPKFKKKRSE